MRRFLLPLPLLLLSLPLLSQVKILMPVVVKDASGRAVSDLKQSDFEIGGPKGTAVDRMWLVPPETVSKDDPRIPIVVLYDAANPTAEYDPDRWTKYLRSLLSEVAKDRLPVTFYMNTPDGLKLIYDRATPPEILATALELTANSSATSADPKVQNQAKQLKPIETYSRVTQFRFDHPHNLLNSMIEMAQLLQGNDERKLLVWMDHYNGNPYDYSHPEMMEVAVEQLNAAHVSVCMGDNSPFVAIVQRTGGVSLHSLSWNTIQTVSRDFGPYYMLAVTVPAPKETDWIPIKVKVSRPGLTVRAAPGFLGLKPLKTSKAPAAQP
jgi:hypothetical protein